MTENNIVMTENNIDLEISIARCVDTKNLMQIISGFAQYLFVMAIL